MCQQDGYVLKVVAAHEAVKLTYPSCESMVLSFPARKAQPGSLQFCAAGCKVVLLQAATCSCWAWLVLVTVYEAVKLIHLSFDSMVSAPNTFLRRKAWLSGKKASRGSFQGAPVCGGAGHSVALLLRGCHQVDMGSWSSIVRSVCVCRHWEYLGTCGGGDIQGVTC
jgi:hypothetical protein